MTLALVVCRTASDALAPGAVTGYQCAICSKPLQVSPKGVGQIRGGGVPLCNPCGLTLAALAGDRSVSLNPAAQDALKSMTPEERSEWLGRLAKLEKL